MRDLRRKLHRVPGTARAIYRYDFGNYQTDRPVAARPADFVHALSLNRSGSQGRQFIRNDEAPIVTADDHPNVDHVLGQCDMLDVLSL